MAIATDHIRLLFAALCLNGAFYELFSSSLEALFADSTGVTGGRKDWYVRQSVITTLAAGAGPAITLGMLWSGIDPGGHDKPHKPAGGPKDDELEVEDELTADGDPVDLFVVEDR